MGQNQRLISHLGAAVFLFEKTFIVNECVEAIQSSESTQKRKHRQKQIHTHAYS